MGLGRIGGMMNDKSPFCIPILTRIVNEIIGKSYIIKFGKVKLLKSEEGENNEKIFWFRFEFYFFQIFP